MATTESFVETLGFRLPEHEYNNVFQPLAGGQPVLTAVTAGTLTVRQLLDAVTGMPGAGQAPQG